MKRVLIVLGIVLIFGVLIVHAGWGPYYLRCKELNDMLEKKLGANNVEVDGYMYSFSMPSFLAYDGRGEIGEPISSLSFTEEEEVNTAVTIELRRNGEMEIDLWLRIYTRIEDGSLAGRYSSKFYCFRVDEQMNLKNEEDKRVFDLYYEELKRTFDKAATVWEFSKER